MRRLDDIRLGEESNHRSQTASVYRPGCETKARFFESVHKLKSPVKRGLRVRDFER